MSKHYDVVVLGTSVGALASAALLARRSWRVLVVGHGARPARYRFGEHALARRTFSFLGMSSPAFGRVLVELAQSQTFRRRVRALDPMLAVLGPTFRLELPPDQALFFREIDREFPEVRRVVDTLYNELSRTNGAADAAFERDVVWPPGSFWERRETKKARELVPAMADEEPTLLAEFPREHPYRDVIRAPAAFATDLAGPLPPFALARLHGAWTRGVFSLQGGEDELVEFFLERVRAHGGDVRLSDRVLSLVHRSGRVRGVEIDGETEPLGVGFVVADGPAQALLELAPNLQLSRRVVERMPEVSVGDGRFVTSIVVREGGVPAPLPVHAFLLPRAPGLPEVYLERLPGAAPGTTHLVTETLVAPTADVTRMREDVLTSVEAHLPFLDRCVICVDSPHDGRPLWSFEGGRRRDVDRATLRSQGASLDAEPMVPRWLVTPSDCHGLAGEPVRAPLDGAFLAGPTVMPALGQEGQLLAAWGAARIITRTDSAKEKMRRDMWSKVELA
jgi:glycine/D-amino acid oxidase-like deaminating enzyme